MKKVILIAMTALVVMSLAGSVFASSGKNAPPGDGRGCCGGCYYSQN